MRDCPALHMVCERVAEWVAHVRRVAAGVPSHSPVVGSAPAHTWRLPDRHGGDNGKYTRSDTHRGHGGGGGGRHQVRNVSCMLPLSLALSRSCSLALSLSSHAMSCHATSHLGVASCPCHWVPLLLALGDNRVRDTVIDPRAPHARTTVRIGRGRETGTAVIATLREVASYEGGPCEESRGKSDKGEKVTHTEG